MHSTPLLTLDQLRQQLAELLGTDVSGLDPNASLLDWGLDSMRLMTLTERLRQTGFDVSFGDLAEEPTLAAWVQRLSLSR